MSLQTKGGLRNLARPSASLLALGSSLISYWYSGADIDYFLFVPFFFSVRGSFLILYLDNESEFLAKERDRDNYRCNMNEIKVFYILFLGLYASFTVEGFSGKFKFIVYCIADFSLNVFFMTWIFSKLHAFFNDQTEYYLYSWIPGFMDLLSFRAIHNYENSLVLSLLVGLNFPILLLYLTRRIEERRVFLCIMPRRITKTLLAGDIPPIFIKLFVYFVLQNVERYLGFHTTPKNFVFPLMNLGNVFFFLQMRFYHRTYRSYMCGRISGTYFWMEFLWIAIFDNYYKIALVYYFSTVVGNPIDSTYLRFFVICHLVLLICSVIVNIIGRSLNRFFLRETTNDPYVVLYPLISDNLIVFIYNIYFV